MTLPLDPTTDFHWPADATAMAQAIIGRFNLTGDQGSLVSELGRMMADRDRALEDYLNRHIVRNLYISNPVRGGITTVTPGDFTNPTPFEFPHFATPTCSLFMSKAYAESALRIDVQAAGRYHNNGGAAGDLSFGMVALSYDTGTIISANVTDLNGGTFGSGYVEGCRGSFVQNEQFYMSGIAGVLGLPAGPLQICLAVASITAAGGSLFQLMPDTDCRIAATEIPNAFPQ